jgi:hypothetical protein
VHEEKVGGRNRAWSWCSHGGRILEKVGVYLESIGAKF